MTRALVPVLIVALALAAPPVALAQSVDPCQDLEDASGDDATGVIGIAAERTRSVANALSHDDDCSTDADADTTSTTASVDTPVGGAAVASDSLTVTHPSGATTTIPLGTLPPGCPTPVLGCVGTLAGEAVKLACDGEPDAQACAAAAYADACDDEPLDANGALACGEAKAVGALCPDAPDASLEECAGSVGGPGEVVPAPVHAFADENVGVTAPSECTCPAVKLFGANESVVVEDRTSEPHPRVLLKVREHDGERPLGGDRTVRACGDVPSQAGCVDDVDADGDSNTYEVLQGTDPLGPEDGSWLAALQGAPVDYAMDALARVQAFIGALTAPPGGDA